MENERVINETAVRSFYTTPRLITHTGRIDLYIYGIEAYP